MFFTNRTRRKPYGNSRATRENNNNNNNNVSSSAENKGRSTDIFMTTTGSCLSSLFAHGRSSLVLSANVIGKHTMESRVFFRGRRFTHSIVDGSR